MSEPTPTQKEHVSSRYPSVTIAPGLRMHVFSMDGLWHIWLNTKDTGDFTGVALASKPTVAEAVEDATNALVAGLQFLQRAQ